MTSATRGPDQGDSDIRPLVAETIGNRGAWVFGVLLLMGGAGLFVALEVKRSAAGESTQDPEIVSNRPTLTSPPELVLPEGYGQGNEFIANPYPSGVLRPYRIGVAGQPDLPPGVRTVAPRPRPARPVEVQSIAGPQPYFPGVSPASTPYAPPAQTPAIVYQAPSSIPPQTGATSPGAQRPNERAYADRLANPAVTVPQGTVIQAVMETALDSTRPGFVRAIVSRDVRGFDGSRVLIPRGSRLYGEYKSEVSQGQNRAVVGWQRLLRPDGVTMNIESPATDPLGRTGIKGNVNSHFFARFGGAILQSVLDLGVGLATRPLRDGVVVAFPQGSAAVGVPQIGQNVTPTLAVPQGRSVSVYVARDLDFSGVES